MIRTMLKAVTIAVAIAVATGFGADAQAQATSAGGDAANGPCGYYGHPPCNIAGWNACELVTIGDLTAVSGESWTQKGSGPMRPLAGAALINQCQYDGQGQSGDDIEITIVHKGGRAEFEQHAHASDMHSVSGVGDAASLNAVAGGARMLVLQNGTYFEIRFQTFSPNPNLGAWATALGRKAADRIKAKQ